MTEQDFQQHVIRIKLEGYMPMGLRPVTIVPWLKLMTADASPAMFWV